MICLPGEFAAGRVRPGRAQLPACSPGEAPHRVPVEQNVREELVALLVRTPGVGAGVGTELERFQRRAVQGGGPVRPSVRRFHRGVRGVPRHGHRVRLSLTTRTAERERAELGGRGRFRPAQRVDGRAVDARQLDGAGLEDARLVVRGEVGGRALEAFVVECVPLLQVEQVSQFICGSPGFLEGGSQVTVPS